MRIQVNALVEELRACQEPNRLIDARIEAYLRVAKKGRLSGVERDGCVIWVDRDGNTCKTYAPPYTASIDAVLTLTTEFLPKHRCMIDCNGKYKSAKIFNPVTAILPIPEYAPNLALAACLAFFKEYISVKKQGKQKVLQLAN